MPTSAGHNQERLTIGNVRVPLPPQADLKFAIGCCEAALEDFRLIAPKSAAADDPVFAACCRQKIRRPDARASKGCYDLIVLLELNPRQFDEKVNPLETTVERGIINTSEKASRSSSMLAPQMSRTG